MRQGWRNRLQGNRGGVLLNPHICEVGIMQNKLLKAAMPKHQQPTP